MSEGVIRKPYRRWCNRNFPQPLLPTETLKTKLHVESAHPAVSLTRTFAQVLLPEIVEDPAIEGSLLYVPPISNS